MKLIEEKKIHPALCGLMLYLSFCMANWYTSRGGWAHNLSSVAMLQTVFLANDIVAFLVAGLLPFLFFEVIAMFVFRFCEPRLGKSVVGMRYAARFFYIPANLVLFALKLFYLLSPLISVYGNILLDFLVPAVFLVFYLKYCAAHYAEKQNWSAMIAQLGGAFLIVSMLSATLSGLGVL